MDIFSILSMIGGLCLFLFGMDTMGSGLVKISGGKLEKILERLTSRRIMAFLTGVMVTAVIQSSSATTVMVVGFVNSGIMQLQQAVGIIMGANVGTTVTSWILSLTGLQGDNIVVKLLEPTSFSPVFAAVGIVMIMASKDDSKYKDIGSILIGFAVLMFGMTTMSSAVEPLADNEAFTSILTKFSNPLLGILAGAVLTAIIQSSSASVGILQALCSTGAVGYSTAIPIIMGQNIGTCVTALISSIGANKNARRASMIHLYFNLIGTVLFLILFYTVNKFVDFHFMHLSASPAGIAVIHSCFNIGCAAVLYPFANQLVKLATITIPDKEEHEEDTRPKSLIALDERFLDRPAFALQLCRKAVEDMADTARDSFLLAMDNLKDHSDAKEAEVIKKENICDEFEDTLGTYLVKISGQDLSKKDTEQLSIMLHCITDFERISDHAVNVVESAQEMRKMDAHFSAKGQAELDVYSQAVGDILRETVEIFNNNDTERARYIEPLEETIDTLSDEMKQRHVNRLTRGECSFETGIILDDLLTNYERVSDHCSNVAVCMIEVNNDNFDTHEYLKNATSDGNIWFSKQYAEMTDKYKLPDLDS